MLKGQKIGVVDVRKTYESDGNAVEALRGVSLEIASGEFTAIAGPSGSGKSTLLNLIGGLDRPTSGKILFGSTDITRLSNSQLCQARLKHIGFIFQAYNLIPVLTVAENVEYVMLLQGGDPGERREKALAMLAEVGLEGYGDRWPSKLSGGQQQRVAVARAIVSSPDLVLADEPTANLDSKTAGSLLDLMASLNEKLKITFIFSSHDPLVLSRARRVVRLHDGQIQA
jgi:putative ABC transport system ATP-binding protein